MTQSRIPNELWDRFARLVLKGDVFCSDDITDEGRWAVDPYHLPNGAQSSIGAVFRLGNQRGWITSVGFHNSKAVTRRAGTQQDWQPTPEGRRWSARHLGEDIPLPPSLQPPSSDEPPSDEPPDDEPPLRNFD